MFGEVIFIFDNNQLITVRLNNSNRNWYENKGYIYTKRYDFIQVRAKDLPLHSDAKIKAICDYCGKEYTTSYCVLTNQMDVLNKHACYDCSGYKTKELNKIKRKNNFLRKANKICCENGYVLVTDEYKKSNEKIRFICPKHGEQELNVFNFLHGRKCYYCGRESASLKQLTSVEEIQNYISQNTDCVWINPSEYTGQNDKCIKLKCSCGNIFYTTYSCILRKGVCQCFSCSSKESVSEREIREYLETNKIAFIQEKRFKDCRDIKPLPFDFYLPDYNLIIEFDGIHHYKPVRGDDDFKIVKNHDRIKNIYCRNNNIELLRISYLDVNDKINIIENKLNNISKRYSLVS